MNSSLNLRLSKQLPILLLSISSLIFTSSCSKKETKTAKIVTESKVNTISKVVFGIIDDSTSAYLYTLTNTNGVKIKITNFGGIIVSIETPDKNGKLSHINLGFDSLSTYLKPHPYFGAIIGRYGNRIAKGKFTLNDNEYNLAINNEGNSLHGGTRGFDKALWSAEIVESENGSKSLRLTYLSVNMEEGYPGNLKTEVIYTLKDDNSLQINYSATTDEATVVNLTNHTYFNLNGDSSDVLSHELYINADKFVPVDKTLIPTGILQEVKNTPFDFSTPIAIGIHIDDDNTQIGYGAGFDHTWVLNKSSDSLILAATVYEPTSGRFLEVFTTEPGIQFYTGNFLNGSNIGFGGKVYNRRSGFCLETQHFPNSPNQRNFPSVILNPSQTYNSCTVYKFSAK